MKYLLSLLLLITLPGCMMLGGHGMHEMYGMLNHDTSEETKVTNPGGEPAKPTGERSTHPD
jgi:hypothetical protein